MSSGAFLSSKYELDDGKITRIKVQPETITTVNVAPTGELVAGLPSATVSKGIREYGIGARSITLRWTGAAPDDYKADGTIKVPILTKDVWDGIALGSTFTYLGLPAVVIGKSPERVK